MSVKADTQELRQLVWSLQLTLAKAIAKLKEVDKRKPVIVRQYMGGGRKITSLTQLTDKSHGDLDDRADDSKGHSIYALLAGRAGGQTLIGGTTSGEDLTLESTSHATKGNIICSDDLDLSSVNIDWAADMVLYAITSSSLSLRNAAKSALRTLQCDLGAGNITYISTSGLFSSRNVGGSSVAFRAGTTQVAKITTTGADFAISRAGDISFLDTKFPILDKTSGNGIKVDTTTPTFGWRDLLGQIRTRGVGGTDPNDATYIGNIKAYQFSVNDECWVDYHIPHDYVKGTDIHLHFHWSHNNAFVTGGNVTWAADITYSKGHNQAPFPATVNTTVVGNASTTQYQHIITEVQVSTSGGAAGQIDTDDIEPDGVIMIRGYLSANNITVSEGAVPDPFLHFKDIHYQSTNIATKDKVPDFYA